MKKFLQTFESVQNKILLALVPGISLSLIAMGIALYQLYTSNQGFKAFMAHDLVRMQTFEEMHAQGILGGQAIRNLMLDKADPLAQASLEKANAAFRHSLKTAMDSTTPGSDEAKTLTMIDAKWDALEGLRDMYVQIVGVQSDARERFVREETPLWRDIGTALIDLRAKEMDRLKQAQAGIDSRAKHALNISTALIMLAIIAGLGMAILVLRQVNKSLTSLRDSMGQMANGVGDLRTRLAVQSGDEVGQTSHAFNTFMEGLRGLVVRTKDHAQDVGAQVQAVSAEATQVTSGSREQSEAAAAVAAAVEQLSVSIASVASSAEDVRRLSEENIERAEDSDHRMEELSWEIERMHVAMKEIESTISRFMGQTAEINSLTDQVQNIADQTNLLALNAAIEAARAGEHGRGFAVVADEVRRLAEQSSTSARRIDAVTGQIETQSAEVNQAILSGTQAMEKGISTLNEVRRALENTKQAARNSGVGVNEIVTSVREQEAASHDIARHIERIAHMAEHNQQAVDRTMHTIRHIDGLMGEMNQGFSKFNT